MEEEKTENNEIKIEEKRKTGKIKIILVLVLLAIVLFASSNLIERKMIEGADNLHDLISSQTAEEGMYVKIELAYLPYKYATANDTLYYYFVLDDSGYLYIVRLTDDTYEYLESIADESGKLSYDLTGYTVNIPEQLEEITISSYNEVIEDDLLTEENFESYVGTVYVDETMTPTNNVALMLKLIALVFGIIACIILLVYIVWLIKQLILIKKEKTK